MKKNKLQTKINRFDFAPDRISIRLIGSRSSDMSDFENLVRICQQEFSDLHITLSKEAFTYKVFAFVIESDSYIKFKRIRKIIDFLENSVVIDDTVEVETGDIYF